MTPKGSSRQMQARFAGNRYPWTYSAVQNELAVTCMTQRKESAFDFGVVENLATILTSEELARIPVLSHIKVTILIDFHSSHLKSCSSKVLTYTIAQISQFVCVRVKIKL